MSLGVKQHLNNLFGPMNESLLGVIQLLPNQPFPENVRDVRDDPRYLCLTTKRNGKAKLSKVKHTLGSYTISKAWAINDLQALEILDRTTFVTVFNKPQKWTTTESNAKDDFLTTLLKLSKKKPPKLINVDTGLIKASNFDLRGDTNQTNRGKFESTDDKPIDDNDSEFTPQVELVNVEELLKDLNWKSNNGAAAIEKKLQNDLTQIEMDNIHALIESTQRTDEIAGQIDKAIQKLDEMSSWIASYTSTLSKIAPKVQFIQNQNRRSHTYTRNQALLKSTLADFLTSLIVPAELEKVLRRGPLDLSTLPAIERATQALLAAQHTQLDPDLFHLAVVQEQTKSLQDLSSTFATRLVMYVTDLVMRECEVIRGDWARTARIRSTLYPGDHADRELALIPFRNLMLWLKQAESLMFQNAITGYIQHVQPVYQADFKDVIDSVRGTIKSNVGSSPDTKPSSNQSIGQNADTEDHGNHVDYLFTSPLSVAAQVADKMSTGLSKAGSRNALSALRRSVDSRRGGRGKQSGSVNEAADDCAVDFGSAFSLAIENSIATIQREQNFIVGMFHFYVNPPSFEAQQSQEDPQKWRDKLPEYAIDAKSADIVKDIMGDVFDGFARDLGLLTDSGLAKDHGSAIVMLNAVEKQLDLLKSNSRKPRDTLGAADLSYFYLYGVLNALQIKLRAAWAKVLDQQLRAIQESKLAKKKSGVLSFVRTCPRFIEHLIDAVEAPLDPVRSLLENAMEAVLKLVILSIESIPVIDDEVLILENTSYLVGELRNGPASSIPALNDHIRRLQAISLQHIEEYVRNILHKAFGKFMDFLVGLETLLISQTPEEVAFHQAYSKIIAKKITSSISAKDMAKICEYIYRKISRALSDPGVIDQVWLNALQELERIPKRAGVVLGDVYRGDVQLEFGLADVKNACLAINQ